MSLFYLYTCNVHKNNIFQEGLNRIFTHKSNLNSKNYIYDNIFYAKQYTH